jgi:hypothetical protein
LVSLFLSRTATSWLHSAMTVVLLLRPGLMMSACAYHGLIMYIILRPGLIMCVLSSHGLIMEDLCRLGLIVCVCQLLTTRTFSRLPRNRGEEYCSVRHSLSLDLVEVLECKIQRRSWYSVHGQVLTVEDRQLDV